MTFSEYQRVADETRRFNNGGPHSGMAPMLGVAGVTGSVLEVYKRFLRDEIDLSMHKDFLRDQLGDLLWYAAAVATTFNLDLGEVAQNNLQRTRNLYGTPQTRLNIGSLPILDATYPEHERFPRKIVIEFTSQRERTEQLTASLKLISATPNAFPEGQKLINGKRIGFTLGANLGEPLTDNSRRADAYRFHDAIHMGFLAVLGWSPTMRSLLRLKRKSNPDVDECEDGARAIYAEEGLAAVLSRLAERRSHFVEEKNIDGDALDAARSAVIDLEVQRLPMWIWRIAISQGFSAMHKLSQNDGGFLTADLDARLLTYSKLLS